MRRGAVQVAAERVDRHGIGAVQAAHEVRDGVGGIDEAAVHVVAGIEQHEDVGARVGIDARFGVPGGVRPGGFVGGQQGPGRAVLHHLQGGLAAFGEGGHLLRDAVLEDAKVARLEPVNVTALAVGDGEAQHHHVHLHAEHGSRLLLGEKKAGQQDRRRQQCRHRASVHDLLPDVSIIGAKPSALRRCANEFWRGHPRPRAGSSAAAPASPPGGWRKSAPPSAGSTPE